MSGSNWEPALMLGVLLALMLLSVWHFIEPLLLRAWARSWRFRDTVVVVCVLPVMVAYIVPCIVRGQYRWWKRERAAVREFRQQWRANEAIKNAARGEP